MSVVVALKEQSRVYLGSDSLATNESGQVWYGKDKFWKSSMNENILIGSVGNLEVLEYVQHSHPFVPETPNQNNVHEWLLPLLDKYKDLDDPWEFLICGNGKIFTARWEGLILESKNFEAIGGARDIAMGALYATQGLIPDPEERIRRAISAAMLYNVGVGGNINISMI